MDDARAHTRAHTSTHTHEHTHWHTPTRARRGAARTPASPPRGLACAHSGYAHTRTHTAITGRCPRPRTGPGQPSLRASRSLS